MKDITNPARGRGLRNVLEAQDNLEKTAVTECSQLALRLYNGIYLCPLTKPTHVGKCWPLALGPWNISKCSKTEEILMVI